MPDVCYRASILGSFQMDPRSRPAGMTKHGAMPDSFYHPGHSSHLTHSKLPRGQGLAKTFHVGQFLLDQILNLSSNLFQ